MFLGGIMRNILVLMLALCMLACSDQNPNKYMDNALEGKELKFYTVTIQDIPEVYEQLASNGSNSSCATFAFFPQALLPLKIPKKEHIEVQYCIEDNDVGFDWVLIGDTKYRDQKTIESYFIKSGYEYSLKKTNNVQYLRVVNGNLIKLLSGILTDVYGLTTQHKMELVAARFKIQGLDYSTHELYSSFYANQ
jgi:hypothetical protein